MDVHDRELAQLIAQEFPADIDLAYAAKLLEAARPLWRVLEDAAFVDSFGGAECHRILPAMLAMVHREANELVLEQATVPAALPPGTSRVDPPVSQLRPGG